MDSLLFLILGMDEWTIIVPAGGVGTRMGADRPKQYLEIDGQPLLLYTLLALDKQFDHPRFIIALASAWKTYLLPFIVQSGLNNRCVFVEGGEERYHSVKNALVHVQTNYIAVHDAVRPFISQGCVARLKESIKVNEAVIPVVQLKESLRQIENGQTYAVDRSAFLSVQTPQCFHSSVLQQAYEMAFDSPITDDASLVERIGVKVATVWGNDKNIKITTPLDFILAEQLIHNA